MVSPPVPKSVGRWARWNDGAFLISSRRVQGAQPPPGVQGESPCSGKRWRVGRWDNGAGQANPPADRGRRPQQGPPSRLCPTPIAKYERVCYGTPMKWAAGPLLLLGACRIHEHWGLTTEDPPVAGALREHPKGQDPPRKAGTGANAVIRHRLFGAIPLHYGSVTVRYGAITVPLRLVTPYYAPVTASVPASPEIRLTTLTTFNQRPSLPLYSGEGLEGSPCPPPSPRRAQGALLPREYGESPCSQKRRTVG